MAADEEFTRARCDATGAIAALSRVALELGHIPGWKAIDGPIPEGPKSAAFPPKPTEPPLEPPGEPPAETADSKSAKQTTKE